MEDVRVAAVMMSSVVGRTSDNLVKIETFVRKAASQGVQIICFPEANITGYSIQETIGTYAESVPGPSSDVLVSLSKSTGLTILCGLIEKSEGGNLFISHIVVSPEGLGDVYRKLHLAPREDRIYTQGSVLPTYRRGNVAFGIELCYDTHFPELTTVLALRGIDILFLPYASPQETSIEKRERWLRYLPARAYDNSIFVVACNQVGCYDAGGEFPGVVLVLDPKGRTISEACTDEEKIVVTDLKEASLAEVRKSEMGFFMNHRRPEIYSEITFLQSTRKMYDSGALDYN